MKKNFKVLLVEDRPMAIEVILWGIEVRLSIAEQEASAINVLVAETIPQAEELFAANPDIDAVLMDACVPGIEPNTEPLVKKMRERSAGLDIIAISDRKEYRERLMQAGCNHEVDDDGKRRAPKKLLEVLGLL